MAGESFTLRESAGLGGKGPSGNHASELQANDPLSGKTVWRVPFQNPNMAPVFATAGDLVFQGGPDEGVFRAFNARTGQLVWSYRTGSNFRNSPISYVGPDGRQYVAVIGSQAPANPPIAATAAADAPARLVRSGSALYVFALAPAGK